MHETVGLVHGSSAKMGPVDKRGPFLSMHSNRVRGWAPIRRHYSTWIFSSTGLNYKR